MADSGSDNERWMPMRLARRILPVSEATLRQWADYGLVRSFRTHGGHRRFSQDDLRALLRNSMPLLGGHTVRGLDEAALQRIRRRLRSVHVESEEWYRSIDEAQREQMREMGRQLLVLIARYLGEQRQRAELAAEVRVLGEEYGSAVARGNLPLHLAVSGFLFFRNALMDAAREALRRTGITASEMVQTWRRVVRLTDRVLLAMVGAYEVARAKG